MSKFKLFIAAIVMIATLGMLASPASAGTGSGFIGSNGSGTTRKCGFWGYNWYKDGSSRFDIFLNSAYTQYSACTTPLLVSSSSVTYVVQMQKQYSPGWSNYGNAQSFGPNTVGADTYHIASIETASVSTGNYRLVVGYAVVLNGVTVQTFAITDTLAVA